MLNRQFRKELLLAAVLLAGLVLLTGAGVLFDLESTALAQGTDSFEIDVPTARNHPVTPGQFPLSRLKVTVSIAEDGPVAFMITDPRGVAKRIPEAGFFSPVAGGDVTDPVDMCEMSCLPPTGTMRIDAVQIEQPDADLPAGDPARRRYVIHISLNSDFDPNPPNFCSNTMNDDSDMDGFETWTVELDQPGSSNAITGVCTQSFERDGGMAGCLFNNHYVDPNDDPPVAQVNGFDAPCDEERPAVDAVLVLDKSGSMRNSVTGGSPTDKIEALREAVVAFVNQWAAVRASEDTVQDDNLGLVFFDTTADWWEDPGNDLSDGLNDFETARAEIIDPIATDEAAIDTVEAGGSTSLGGGLDLADGELTSADKRQVVLLMSDGKQNRQRKVACESGDITAGEADCTNLVTHPHDDPLDTTPLTNANNGRYQIYAVTVGTGESVNATINENIARATGGFYINTEDDADLLSPFFWELLQNFLKFNTIETVLLTADVTSENEPFSTTFAAGSASRSLHINMRWEAVEAYNEINLTVMPPGGGPSDMIAETRFLSRDLQVIVDLPLGLEGGGTADPEGDWEITIEPDCFSTFCPPDTLVPFYLSVTVDDLGLKSDLAVVEADYVEGDQIKLQARVDEFGVPILGLDTAGNPGDRVQARVSQPGVTLGDLLSDSTAPATSTLKADAPSPAEAKLFNHLQDNPDSLTRPSTTVALLDNGAAANGDAVAGDGVYTALFPADNYGHYNILFDIQGSTEEAGRFTRQQLRSVYVRPLPDAAQTEVQTEIARTGQQNQYRLTLTFTPRTQAGHRLGPGWRNYMPLTVPGGEPFRAEDNLDGTYTAELIFTSDETPPEPPPVTIHFLDVLFDLDDSVPLDKLPVPLDRNTALQTVFPRNYLPVILKN